MLNSKNSPFHTTKSYLNVNVCGTTNKIDNILCAFNNDSANKVIILKEVVNFYAYIYVCLDYIFVTIVKKTWKDVRLFLMEGRNENVNRLCCTTYSVSHDF